MDTSIVQGKESKSKGVRKKKQTSSKFMSLGKDQTVSILHGVGRVLNPKGISIIFICMFEQVIWMDMDTKLDFVCFQ